MIGREIPAAVPLKKWRERGGLLTIRYLERKYYHWISV
jgi:hypothetical protein